MRFEGRILWKEPGMTDWIRGMPAQIENVNKNIWLHLSRFGKASYKCMCSKEGNRKAKTCTKSWNCQLNWQPKLQKNPIWTMPGHLHGFICCNLLSSLQRTTEVVSDIVGKYFSPLWRIWVFYRFSYSGKFKDPWEMCLQKYISDTYQL